MATVLIADDEEALRVLAESVLEELGHRTLSAADPIEALAVHRANGIDLLITDSGEGITDGLRALFVDGAAFLPKPCTVDGLRTALAALLTQTS